MRAIGEGAEATVGREITVGFALPESGAEGEGVNSTLEGSGFTLPEPICDDGGLGLVITASRPPPPVLRGTLVSFGLAMEPAT